MLDIKDITAWGGAIGMAAVGIVWLWKKIFKPITRVVRQYTIIRDNSLRISGMSSRIDCLIFFADIALFEADMQGNIINANQSFLNVFGAINEGEVLGYGFINNFVNPSDRTQQRMEWLENIKRDSEVIKNITIIHGITGEKTVVKILAKMNRDGKGSLENILGKAIILK